MTRSKTRAKKKAQAIAGNVNANGGSEAAEAAAYYTEQQRMLVAQQRQREQLQLQQKNQQQQLGNGHVHAHHHHHHPQQQQPHPSSQANAHAHHHHPPHPPTHQHQSQSSSQDPAELSKKMVPISDKALAMLNHMLGNRGMMQRDPSTGAIDVVLNTELFPNLTLPFPALEVPSKGSGDPEEDIRDVLNKVAGGVLGGITAMQQNMGPNAKPREPGNGSLGNKQVMGVIGGGMPPGGPFPGGKLPNLEDLLKLPIFQTGPNGTTMTNDNAPALSKYLFQPHPSSSAPYASAGTNAASPGANPTTNRGKGKQPNGMGPEGYQQQQQAARSSDPNGQLSDTSRYPLPPQPNRPQTDASDPRRAVGQADFDVARREGREYGTVFDADGRATTVYNDAHEHVVHTCPHCDEVHEPPPHGYTDEEEDYDEDYSYYESEESFEYDDDEEGEVEDDEGIDDVSHLSHPPDDEYDDDDLDDEDEEGIPETFSIGDVENELGPDRETEREEARDFFSRVFGKGKEKQRQEVPQFEGQPGMIGPGGQQPHHVCGPECREPTPRQVSEARHKKELFFEKMKVAFMYDGWPEELLKKKWSELTDQEREYIRRTVLARATDGPICEDEKSKARLMKKGWPESALSKRWSELTDTERKRILQVEAGAGQEDEVSIRTREPMLAAQLMPPNMPGSWAGCGQGGDKADPVLLSIGGTLVEDAQRADADALREAIIQYGSVSAPFANGQDKLAFPEITGPNGQAPTLDEPTKAEVRKKLARFHAKATETAKWIMSHLETSSGIDPYLRGSLEEAKQVFEDFRSNFKVPDFLQEQMDVATIMYDDLNGTALNQMQPGPDAAPRSDEPVPPTTNGTGEKKKKKKQKKKKKRKSEGGGQQQGQGQDQGGEAGRDDQDKSEDEGNKAPASILDDPEKLDWACNELFQWIKTCLWSIEQDAIRTAQQSAAAHTKSNKKNNGKQSGGKGKSESEIPRDIQITWALPDLAHANGASKDGSGDMPVTNVTWTPRPAPDAEQMRARLRSIGIDVPPAA